MREPRSPRQTARQRRAEAYEQQWVENRGKNLPPSAVRKVRIARGTELVRALELLRDATGNPFYASMLEAARRDGFGAIREGHLDYDYLVLVEFYHRRGKLDEDERQERRLLNRRRLSIREACEVLVAEAGLPGPRPDSTFDDAAEQLRQRYIAQPPRKALKPLDLLDLMGGLAEFRIASQLALKERR